MDQKTLLRILSTHRNDELDDSDRLSQKLLTRRVPETTEPQTAGALHIFPRQPAFPEALLSCAAEVAIHAGMPHRRVGILDCNERPCRGTGSSEDHRPDGSMCIHLWTLSEMTLSPWLDPQIFRLVTGLGPWDREHTCQMSAEARRVVASRSAPASSAAAPRL